MVSVLQAAIRMAWVISLVSVSSLTMPGLCSLSGIFAGTALASVLAASRSRRAAWTGASSRARASLGITTLVPGAGLRRAASFSWRAASALARGFFAVLSAAAGFLPRLRAHPAGASAGAGVGAE